LNAVTLRAAHGRRDKVISCQYRADRGRRTLRGIDEQVAKAEKAVAGIVPVKRNRLINLAGGEKLVNRSRPRRAGSPGSRATPPTSLPARTGRP
jgi:hypothetical protein